MKNTKYKKLRWMLEALIYSILFATFVPGLTFLLGSILQELSILAYKFSNWFIVSINNLSWGIQTFTFILIFIVIGMFIQFYRPLFKGSLNES